MAGTFHVPPRMGYAGQRLFASDLVRGGEFVNHVQKSPGHEFARPVSIGAILGNSRCAYQTRGIAHSGSRCVFRVRCQGRPKPTRRSDSWSDRWPESMTDVSGWSKRRISAVFYISSQVGYLSTHVGDLKSAAFEAKLEKLVHFALT